MSMVRFLLKYVLLAGSVLACMAMTFAFPPDRPNRGKELYVPPWNQEIVNLATSCETLGERECAMLRQLIGMPHALWIGIASSMNTEIHEDLHNLLRDAQREGRVPTLVLYAFPNRGCGSGIRYGKKFTDAQYKKWIDQVSNAVRYYDRLPINIIIEPGGLSDVVTDMDRPCGRRTKSDVLEERIELIRYISWCFALEDNKKDRINPNLRLFVDVGSPGRVTGAKELITLADALEKIIKGAVIDGISVNVARHDSSDDSIAWAKEIINMVRPSIGRRLTIAVDIGRSGARVDEYCNARGAALDQQYATLDHDDPQVELMMIIKTPGDSDGDGAACHDGAALGSFDRETFLDYVRTTAKTRASLGQ